MKTIVLGSDSILTDSLKKTFTDIKTFSVRNSDNLKELCRYIDSVKKYNIIFNNFYPSKYLNNISEKNYFSLINQSIQFNTKLLNKIDPRKINKIIYTSSASVNNFLETKKSSIRDIYAVSKLLNEKILLSYANKNKLIIIICRLYNIYSEKNDNFSFISKLLSKDKKFIKINNNGNSIRDFIAVSDVAKIYKKLIDVKIKKSCVIQIGTGKGIKLINIYEKLKKIKKFKILNNRKSEEDISISNNKILFSVIGKFNFLSLSSFLSNKFKKKIILNQIPYLQNIIYSNKFIDGIFIFGAGIGGKQTYKILKSKGEKIIAFVDEDKKKINKEIDGIKIISFKDLIGLSSENIIRKIFIAVPSLSEKRLINLEKKLRKISDEIIIIPNRNILKNKYHVSFEDITSFDIKKILGRSEIVYPNNKIAFDNLRKKHILITGGAGSIGSEIVRQLLKIRPSKIFILDNSEFAISNFKTELKKYYKDVFFNLIDIKDTFALDHHIKNNKIDLIFHAAAFKHVEILEDNVMPAVANNIFGTYNLLKSAHKYSADIILISTDKAVKPKNILGYTKRASEIICSLFDDKKINIKIVRFGNVLGSNGSAVPLFLKQLNNNQPLTLTSYDAKRFFMTIREACYLLLECTKLNNKNNLYVLNMGTEIKIFDLIKNLAKICKNFNPDFNISNINLTGLKKGEKLREKLYIGKKFKTKNKNIFSVKEKSYKIEDIKKFLTRIKHRYHECNNKKIVSEIKNFIKN